ncbi:interleukin [bacterium endosymbiont of Bathymodiolus sp. 5 South]|uniref:interleukin n=2 Tax=bacterium endosymbiont of Bathymodiolus sp. 5 South TaxID=1181670 RepID=UPI00214AC1A5|nr:interleukin [bacterium endosymbiont of Bathymodiolus sp. 5 South]
MIFGDNFYPKKIKHKLNTTLIIDDIFNVGDRKPYSNLEEWEYGCLELIHFPNEFSKEGYDEEYEESFIIFLEKNYDLLFKAGAEDFRIMIDVYCSCSEQCNFEIFDKEKLFRLAKYHISLPISIYQENN